MENEKKKDFALRISHANKYEMIIILYDILEIYLVDSIDAIQNNQSEKEGGTLPSKPSL